MKDYVDWSKVVWEDPPPSAGGLSDGVWVGRLAPLKERPQQWALIIGPLKGGGVSALASNISGGKYKGIRAGDFEAVARRNEEGTRIWARYVGNGTREES